MIFMQQIVMKNLKVNLVAFRCFFMNKLSWEAYKND